MPEMNPQNGGAERVHSTDASKRPGPVAAPVRTGGAGMAPSGRSRADIVKNSNVDTFAFKLGKQKEIAQSGIEIASGTGSYLTFEDLVAAIDRNPPNEKLRSVIALAATQGVHALMSEVDGKVTLALCAEDTPGRIRSTSIVAHWMHENFFIRLKSQLSMSPSQVRLLCADRDTYDRLLALTGDPEARAKVLRNLDPEASATKVFYSSISYAIREGVSDIHIEPYKGRYRIRFRIDGVMRTRFEIPHEVGHPLVAIIKNKANMKLQERRRPQDGTVRFKEEDLNVDSTLEGWSLRASVVPSVEGESAVMRLLQKERPEDFNMLTLGFPPKVLDRFERIIAAPQGLVLVTGPTGSGKTKTLYSALNRLNDEETKILTAEEPVEVSIEGLTQVEVNPKIELSFADVLRSFLRQDPDIILVGEVRDEETASTVIQAALTGHLVFATLHTNDSFGVLPRLESLGVAPERIQSTLLGVLSQRLVRTLCDGCREEYAGGEHLNEILGERVVDDSLRLFRPKDHHGSTHECLDCGGIGYIGRRPVVELWVPGAEERAAIMRGEGDPTQLMPKALSNGFEPMLQSGLELVRDGHSSLAELLARVTTIDEMRAYKQLVRRVFAASGAQ